MRIRAYVTGFDDASDSKGVIGAVAMARWRESGRIDVVFRAPGDSLREEVVNGFVGTGFILYAPSAQSNTAVSGVENVHSANPIT
jgi:hypothetical protein